jgi:hypothetical protein
MRDVWDTVPSRYKSPLVIALGVGEIIAIIAASGVIAAPFSAYFQYGLDPDESESLVGPTLGVSQLMAAATALALVVSFVGVFIVALSRQSSRLQTLN